MKKSKTFGKMIAISVLGLSIVLSGCSAFIDNPVYFSMTRDYDTIDVNDDEISYRMGYLGQALLEPSARAEIYNALSKTEGEQKQSKSALLTAANLGTSGQWISDLSVGKYNSSTGSDVGNALAASSLAISLVAGDGSLDFASGVYLPNKFNGKTLNSAEQATLAARQLVANQLKKAAEKMGYTYECVTSCGKAFSLYHFKRNANTDVSHYIHAPESFAVITNIASLMPAGESASLDSLASGVDVAWKSDFGNKAKILLGGSPNLTKDGGIDFKLLNPNDPTSFTFTANSNLAYTDFGDKFNRLVHSTPYTFYGQNDHFPSVLYFNSDVYRFVLNSVATTFDEYVIEKNTL